MSPAALGTVEAADAGATVLVAGGAGYIGSHMAKLLVAVGYRVLTLDRRAPLVPFGSHVVGDIADAALLDAVFDAHPVSAVMHFGGLIQVGESVTHPAKYYGNNVGATLTLLEAMVRHRVSCFIFSSTAAVFGDPRYVPIDEAHPRAPINPYGWSKWMVEQMLEDFDAAYGLRSVCLRYFNAAGTDPGGQLGECHEPETHLIPLVLQAAAGRRSEVTLFGADYDTADGTCIRDYIHVCDLCDAHLLALTHLLAGGGSRRYNLGSGRGYSVAEVIAAAERVTGRPVPRRFGPRRAGDPAVLVADAALARRELGWQPRHADLETIITHAWAWERRPRRVPAEAARPPARLFLSA